MKYIYRATDGSRKAAYEGVSMLRTDHGLVKVMRPALSQEFEYRTFDPYVTVAIIHLGGGERLVID